MNAYSDVCFPSPKVHDEKPGAFADPILASLRDRRRQIVARHAKAEVAQRDATFAFCDTNSLAIICGDRPPDGLLCVPPDEIDAIVSQFDALSPYDPQIVLHMLKVEYPGISDLRCFAASAKR